MGAPAAYIGVRRGSYAQWWVPARHKAAWMADGVGRILRPAREGEGAGERVLTLRDAAALLEARKLEAESAQQTLLLADTPPPERKRKRRSRTREAGA